MDVTQLREYIKKFQFEKLFIEALGWDNPQQQNPLVISLDKNKIQLFIIAQISGVPILKFDLNSAIDLNKKETIIIKIHKEIQKTHNKHLLCIFSEDHFSISYLSKENKLRPHYYFKNQSGDDLVSKLSGIHFGIEEDKPKISEIGDKLKKAFDTEKVTKKFYEDFNKNHSEFQKYILGIESKEDRKWYSSILLNRLMFIWFLQKKGFVNNDYEYLQTKLNESQKRGEDRYYSEFLTLLFFEGFAKKPKERSEEAKELLGKIKYLNGGLFVPHLIEDKYKNKIKIKDKAFEKTFEIFKNYEWHLQDNRGKDNEISPDVLGYIFEKYINEIQQKSLGAYYTRDEITAYLSRNTIQKCILEKMKEKGHEFQNMSELLQKLDVSLCKLLLTNEDSILNDLTILDPAVGSGAFLVSAMKNLIDIYSFIIGKIKTLGDRDLNKWIEDFEANHKSIPYGIKKNIILKNLYGVDIMKEATEVCKLRLFLSLVSSALDTSELEPLPNMDFNIMHGNSLIGFLNEKEARMQSSFFGESYSQIKNKYNKLVNQYKNKSLSFENLKELKNKIQNFLKKHNSNLNQILADKGVVAHKGMSFTKVQAAKIT